MQKKSLKKCLADKIVNLGNKMAYNGLDDACVLYIYQPKLPKALKKVKK